MNQPQIINRLLRWLANKLWHASGGVCNIEYISEGDGRVLWTTMWAAAMVSLELPDEIAIATATASIRKQLIANAPVVIEETENYPVELGQRRFTGKITLLLDGNPSATRLQP